MPYPGKMGIGVLLVAPDGRREEKSFLLSCTGCINEAELHALCAALDLAAAAGALSGFASGCHAGFRYDRRALH